MSIFDRLARWLAQPVGAQPRASFQSDSAGIVVRTPQELEEVLRTGHVSHSGSAVTPATSMAVPAVYACIRLISGAVATLPCGILRRVDERTRQDASDTSLWRVLNRRPNRWQKPAQFKRMMQAHVLLRGKAFAAITRDARGEVAALVPLHPDRMEVKQLDDLSLQFIWTRKDGRKVTFAQHEILYLVGLTLDGVNGVSVLTYARETIGLSLSMERHGAAVFKNGANVSSALKHPQKLTPEAHARLKSSMTDFRSGGARDGDTIILEEGMEFQQLALTAEDAQWIEARKFSRSDICMFFGVPPTLIGDNSGSDSNWGTGLEQKHNAFRAYCLEDHLTMWEEAVNVDCIDIDRNPDIYCRFNRNAAVQADMKARWEAYVKSLQWGVMSPNEVRALEDQNPREGGDIYYPPPNTAGRDKKEDDDDDQKAA